VYRRKRVIRLDGRAGAAAERVADLHRRAQVSQAANERYLEALAAVDDSRALANWLQDSANL